MDVCRACRGRVTGRDAAPGAAGGLGGVDAIGDDVRDYVVEHLGDPHGVLVVDDTGLCEEGHPLGRRWPDSTRAPSAGSRTAGWGSSWPTGPPKGHAVTDRQVHLPASWTDDRKRCPAAGVPDAVAFATAVEIARGHGRPRLRGGGAGRLGDDGTRHTASRRRYGRGSRSRTRAVRGGDPVATTTWPPPPRWGRPAPTSSSPRYPPKCGAACPRGAGAHRTREYSLDQDGGSGHPPAAQPGPGALAANPSCGISTGEIAYHILARDPAAPTVDLTRVAGTRWAIEECLQQAKNQAGLDQYQASNWRARMRPTPTPGARPGPPARGRWRAAVFARPVVGAGRSAGSTRPDPRTSEPSKVHRGWRDGRVRRCPPGHPLALCSPLLNTAWRVGARWSADDGWRRTGSSREYEGSCQRSTPR